MAHRVKCIYCQQTFDRDKYPYIQVSSRRYAHPACAQAENKKKQEEENDKEKFEKYVMDLLDETYINARVRKQMNTYIEDYNYTYSGMLKALVYFYEVKGNSKAKANGGIGIIPYIYKDAYNYYYNLWMAQQSNQGKVIQDYVPKEKVVVIPLPKRIPMKRRLFTFLDDKENQSEQ